MADPTEQLIAGVVSNALWDVIARSTPFIAREARERLGRPRRNAKQTDVDRILSEFLLSREGRLYVQLRLIASLAGFLGDRHTEDLSALFNQLMSFVIVDGEPSADRLQSARSRLDARIDSELTQDSAANSIRPFRADRLREYVPTLDILSVIHRLSSFMESTQLRRKTVETFAEDLRRQVASRHELLIPPQIDGSRRVPINDIFEPPQFSKGPNYGPLDFAELTATFFRTVVIGNPGAGKSTLAGKMSFDFALSTDPDAVLPIVVTLRDYATAKQNAQQSLLRHLEDTIATRYQIEPPNDVVEYLLLTGRLAPLLDGLDELVATNRRREVVSDVELFGQLYAAAPILVTSRVVGYVNAPLDSRRWSQWTVLPFDEPRISSYAERWFRVTTPAAPRAQILAAAFVSESRVAPDLRSNPLTLALMCTMYRGVGFIPRSRPELLEKCAAMLFDQWDRARDIVHAVPYEGYLDALVREWAWWLYTDDKASSGVTSTQLRSATRDYLQLHRFGSRLDADAAAKEVVSLVTERAWVFTDVGLDFDGDRIYRFTHRTFLEYFAASRLVMTDPRPRKVLEILAPRIVNQEWDAVSQLSVQKLQRVIVDGPSTFYRLALRRLKEMALVERRAMLLFLIRCLRFVHPHVAVVKAVIRETAAMALNEVAVGDYEWLPPGVDRAGPGALFPDELADREEQDYEGSEEDQEDDEDEWVDEVIEDAIEVGSSTTDTVHQLRQDRGTWDRSPYVGALELLAALVTIVDEQGDEPPRQLAAVALKLLRSGDAERRQRILEVLLNLRAILAVSVDPVGRRETDFARRLSNGLIDTIHPFVLPLVTTSFACYTAAWELGEASLADGAQWYPDALIEPVWSMPLHWSLRSIAFLALDAVMGRSRTGDPRVADELSALAPILLRQSRPWMKPARRFGFGGALIADQFVATRGLGYFTSMALAAFTAETADDLDSCWVRSESPLAVAFRPFLSARFDDGPIEAAVLRVREVELPDEYGQLLVDWASGTTSFA